jgi:hypothetical protein
MTEKQQQRRQELDDKFWADFAKYRPNLERIISNQEVQPSDTKLVVLMALHMMGSLDFWEAEQIDKLPPPQV